MGTMISKKKCHVCKNILKKNIMTINSYIKKTVCEECNKNLNEFSIMEILIKTIK